MTSFHRARLYVTREKRKTIRLMLILLILTVFLLLCSAISQSAADSLKEMRRTIPAYFRLDNVNETVLDDERIEQVLACGNIRAYSGENLALVYSEANPPVPGYFSIQGEDEPAHLLRFSAHHRSELAQDFIYERISLAEGRHLMPEDTQAALVSTDFAAWNDLAVGEVIEAGYAPSAIAEQPALNGKTVRCTIIGLFQIDQPAGGGALQAESEMRENLVMVDAETGHALSRAEQNNYCYGVTFQVDDPQGLDALTETVTAKLDPDEIALSVNEKVYQESAAPLERIERLMGLLFAVLTVVSMCILSLVLTLWTRQRIPEIGIYVSLGMSKCAILGQFLIENLSVALFCCLLALPITRGLAAMSGSLCFPAPAACIVVCLIVCAVTAVSALIAALPILRMQPRQIFTLLS